MTQVIDLETALQQKKKRTLLYDNPKFTIFTDGYHAVKVTKVIDIPVDMVSKIIDYKSNILAIFGNKTLICYKKQGCIFAHGELSFYIEYNNISFRFYEHCHVTALYNGTIYKDIYWSIIKKPVICLPDFIDFLKTIDEIYDPKLLSTGTVIYDRIKKLTPWPIKTAYYDVIIITVEDCQ